MKSLGNFFFCGAVATAFFLAGCDQPSPTTQSPSSPPSAGASNAPGVTLVASPNPVPAASGPGTTTITWSSGQSAAAAVYVSESGGEESLFAEGPEGSSPAPWIQAGLSYEFRLYRDKSRKELLARLTVTGRK
jgi:hypothetical protein